MSNIAAKAPRSEPAEVHGAPDSSARPSLSDIDLLVILIESVSAKPAPARVFELGVILNDEHHRNLILLALRSMPDMLAALKEVEAWWLSEGMRHHTGAPYAIFAARAAIAKAVAP